MLNISVQSERFQGGDAAFAQVGWVGQTGGVYPLDGKPHETEPGGFQPLYIQVGRYVTGEDGRAVLED